MHSLRVVRGVECGRQIRPCRTRGSHMIKWRDIELPGFDRPLRAVGKKRRRIFAAFLEELIGNVSRPRARTAEKLKTRPEAMTFADACRACRGHCCSKGGNDAYPDE